MPHFDMFQCLSRRDFLKHCVVGTATAAAAALGLPVLSGCTAAEATFRGNRTIKDDANREVTIPTTSTLERVYFTSALAEIFCFTLAPDLIAATSSEFSKEELKYLPEGMGSLPILGSLSGNGEIDRENLLAIDVQMVFSISGVPLTAQNISEAQNLQDQTGIPVVLIDGSFDKIAAAYRLLGKCLGREKKAEELASYCEDIYAKVTAAIDPIPEEQRTRVYYAEGPEGLQTEPYDSQHFLGFRVGGARDVAEVAITAGGGMSNVSLEHVLKWNPEVIIAWDDKTRGGADEDIRTNPSWADIDAVKNGRVYTMPNIPFSFCDRPPGVNRFIGIQWVANLLYPDRYNIDIIEATKEFYSKCYWVDITDEQAKAILYLK